MKHLLYFPIAFLLLYSFPAQKRTSKASIEFKATTVSFDTVKAGPVIKGEFVFKNKGNEPLIITTVQASDGGTIAFWPEMPIEPGKEGVIQVKLSTTGRKGHQDKLFNVISNAENDLVVLHWQGFLVSGE